jgi:multiple sugar transport system permease protein
MYKKLAAMLLGMLTFVCCYPIVFIITGSLMGSEELKQNVEVVFVGGSGYADWSILPYTFTLRAYVEILLDTPGFLVMFWNSVKVAVGILVGQLLVAPPAAWGLAKFRFPCHKALFLLYIILMMMPFQVLMLSSYLVLNRMNLIDTLWSLILPGIFSTFSVFIMYNSFHSVPEALLEAARIDGAGELHIFMRIGLPLGRGGVISACVISFLECWNLIEQPMTFLKAQYLWPLSLFLPKIVTENAGMAFAASVITLVPPMLVYFMGKKYLEQAISSLSIKDKE